MTDSKMLWPAIVIVPIVVVVLDHILFPRPSLSSVVPVGGPRERDDSQVRSASPTALDDPRVAELSTTCAGLTRRVDVLEATVQALQDRGSTPEGNANAVRALVREEIHRAYASKFAAYARYVCARSDVRAEDVDLAVAELERLDAEVHEYVERDLRLPEPPGIQDPSYGKWSIYLAERKSIYAARLAGYARDPSSIVDLVASFWVKQF